MLVINADDYGLAPAYDEGIVTAARAGAIDGASAMVLRERLDPAPLAATGIAVGLHLELGQVGLERQVELFEEAFGRAPDYLDGHHHCHARGPAGRRGGQPGAGAELAGALRRRTAPAPAALQGRGDGGRDGGADGGVGAGATARDRRVPARRAGAWEGVLEWVVHPGHAARDGGSNYDMGREEDLRTLLELAEEPALREVRGDWRALAA